MINLLPPKNKQELLAEENYKVIVILGINILAVFVCFSLILYSINVFISGEVNSQEIVYKQKEKELQSSQMQDLEQGLINFNKTLYQLDSFYQNQFRATEIFEKLLKVIPPEIYLANLSFSRKAADDKTVDCTLAGFSPTRESLLEFKEGLEKESEFVGVYFSPATWIKSTDINFQITFKISP